MVLKGQSALDFMMTYGWALLLIVLAVGALFALGIFNTGSFIGARAVGFTQVGVPAWRVNGSGAFIVQLSNRAGTNINVSSVAFTFQGATTTNSTVNQTIPNGATSPTLTLGTINGTIVGASYSIPVTITYTDLATSFVYETTGTLTGITG
jgi:hypothetical protein